MKYKISQKTSCLKCYSLKSSTRKGLFGCSRATNYYNSNVQNEYYKDSNKLCVRSSAPLFSNCNVNRLFSSSSVLFNNSGYVQNTDVLSVGDSAISSSVTSVGSVNIPSAVSELNGNVSYITL